MAREQKTTICRICHAYCPLVIDFEDGAPVAIHGDKDDPVYHGYSCIKGRSMAANHFLPSRLLHSMEKQPDGSHKAVASDLAAERIGRRLKAIIDEHGPRSVALYVGTYGFINFAAHAFSLALMRAIESPMVFTSVTIDQPGKGIANALHGPWLAGPSYFEDWGALMLVGNNPLVSMNGALGVNPARVLHEQKKRGMKLVVIDPRETETARHADVFLQCRPGNDPAILAGITRQMIEDGLYDKDFVDAEADGFDALKAAVAPFTPQMVAERAGVDADGVIAAARAYGGADRGVVHAGTGPNMAGRGNLMEYFVRVLTTMRGGWLKAGDERRNPGVLVAPPPAIAATPGPQPAWGFGEELRVRGYTDTAVGLPCAALPDEILTPGEGRVRALLCLGGNPMLAWPDQLKTFEAMKALDLLVCFDPRMSETGKLADYVLAPKLQLEAAANTSAPELFGLFGPGWGYDRPYGHVSEPIMDPPEGADVVEEWESLFDIAKAMDAPLEVRPFVVVDPTEAERLATHVDMSRRPSPDEAWEMTLKGSGVPYAEVKAHPKGHVFDMPKEIVQPKPEGWDGKLDIGNDTMMAELADVAAGAQFDLDKDEEFDFRLISRRLHDMHNSNWHDSKPQQRKWAYNPAFMNPDDMRAIGVAAGDVVEVRSARAAIFGVAEEAPEVRRGCVSMSHAWGRNPDANEDPFTDGANTGRLSFNDRDADPITGIPRMSSIPVTVRPASP